MDEERAAPVKIADGYLTPKEQEVLAYLREHGPTRQGDLADALGTTLRGVGVRLSALAWKQGHHVIGSQGSGCVEDHVWRAVSAE